MTRLAMPERDFPIEQFRGALADAGATILPPTNEWELLRYKLEGKTSVIYVNAKRRVTLTGPHMADQWAQFRKGKPLVRKADPMPVRSDGCAMLYTDASTYHATKSGAWAAVLVLPDGTEHEAHGRLKGKVKSSTAGEAMAVANGLHRFLRDGILMAGATVRVVTDNNAVALKLNSKKPSKAEGVKTALIYVAELAARFGLKITGEWVRGHQKEEAALTDPRVKYNRRCDLLAGAHGKALNSARRGEAKPGAPGTRKAPNRESVPHENDALPPP